MPFLTCFFTKPSYLVPHLCETSEGNTGSLSASHIFIFIALNYLFLNKKLENVRAVNVFVIITGHSSAVRHLVFQFIINEMSINWNYKFTVCSDY